MNTFESAPHELNLAAFHPNTRVLGPGLRAGIWVQGCRQHCPGCIAPAWIPQQANQRVTVAGLAARLAALIDLDGLTLSGGEPMLQAAALAALVKTVRRQRSINVICFTGYTLEKLRTRPPAPGTADLLREVDLLVDGPYQAQANNDRGLRGSTNQQFHFLSDRLQGYNFETWPRSIELMISDGELFSAGIPPRRVLDMLERVPDRLVEFSRIGGV